MKFILIFFLNLLMFSFASEGGVFKKSYFMNKVSKNWEEKVECEDSYSYPSVQCSQSNVDCELVISNTLPNSKLYRICTRFQKVIMYYTDDKEQAYMHAKCVSKSFSLAKNIARIEVFDNSEKKYYGSRPMVFKHKFPTENDCTLFVNELSALNTMITLDFQSETFKFNH